MKKATNIFTIVLIIILLGVIGFSGYKLYTIFQNYNEVTESNEEVRKEYVHVEKDGFPTVDFEGLKALNSDIVGWIYIPDTNVNFPVLRGRDNSVYLHNDYKKHYSFAGSIFMDYLCSEDFSDEETMLYGHNMHNGDMFGRLKKYEDEAYREAHKDVFILLPSGKYMKFRATLGAYISVNDDVYELPKVGDGPKELVLSTCTDDSSDTERFVLRCEYEGTHKRKKTGN